MSLLSHENMALLLEITCRGALSQFALQRRAFQFSAPKITRIHRIQEKVLPLRLITLSSFKMAWKEQWK